ncbi:MAG: 50S ribosomal protein L1 [Alphaproteobacteria bacterium]|nr:MAG: 50S ribosomal protein L1 [Alphaproteobacteria bacterium]
MSKRLKGINEKVDRTKTYAVEDAVKVLKDNAKAKFDESIDIAINLNIETAKTDQNVRGSVVLPNGTGRKTVVAVIARDEKAKEAKAAGADIIGAEDLIEKIKKGDIGFDACVATPDMMGLLGQVAKVLGPKGLMPNPKLGTVTLNVEDIVKSLKAGRVNYKNDKGGVVHAIVGKSSFDTEKLAENIKVFIENISDARPSGAKGKFIKSIHLSTTQGVSLMLEA